MSVDGPPASGSLPYAAAAPSLVGEVLDGRYKILRKLGEGGMGEVFAAEHVHIEKRFAIKLLRPEIISNPEAVSRFRQEARSSSSIGHRNIIAIEDFGQLADGRIYMCMELLSGAALNDLIMERQPVERLLNILIQTGHGLAAAHAKNIVHRDMKPENIFVTFGPNTEDVPKLLDFGIAKVAGNDGQNNLTRTGTIFGTPFYMAPEQALGNPVDARTDIYAMGVIMYEVFSGSLPFQGESFMGILTQHITTEPEPVAQRAAKAGLALPPGLAEIITACMQKNPAQRFQTMDELVNALIPIYRSIAGAGMSTYMEAFPVSSAHPVQTPPPMRVVVPGYSGAGPHYAPSGGASAVGASSSGVYDPGSSTIAPPRSKAGLIIAILAVLGVGGGIAAFVIAGQGEREAGDGSGSDVASNDPGSAGSGADVVATTTPDAAVAAVGPGSGEPTNGSGSGEPNNSSGTGEPTNGSGGGSNGVADAGSSAGSNTGSNAGANAGSGADVTPDAGVPAVAMTLVPLFVNQVKAFEVWEGGTKVFEGPGNFEVPTGGKREVVIKATGFHDKKVTVDAKKKALTITLTRIRTTTPPVETPQPPKCTGTEADLRVPRCRPSFCKAHPENMICNMEQ